ncbi:MAG: glycosyltransferase family 2 protein [Bacteroidota bacterium]
MKISVITVTLNSSTDLQKTLLNILSQGYDDLEIIIIDGGSTDGTIEVIKAYAEQIAYWISEPDNGIYDAMNKGIANASGEWVNFMNAGDVFVNDQTLSMVFNTDLLDADVIYGDSIACYPSFNAYRKASRPEDLWKGMVCCHQAMFFKTDLIKQEAYKPQLHFSADYELILRLFFTGKKFRYIPEPIARFNTRGVSNVNMVNSARSNLEILSSYRGLSPEEKRFHNRFLALSKFTEWVYRILPSAVINSFLKWRYRSQVITE